MQLPSYINCPKFDRIHAGWLRLSMVPRLFVSARIMNRETLLLLNNHSLLYNIFLRSPLKKDCSALYHRKINASGMHRSGIKWHCCVWCFFMVDALSSPRSSFCSAEFVLGKGRGGRPHVWSPSNIKLFQVQIWHHSSLTLTSDAW